MCCGITARQNNYYNLGKDFSRTIYDNSRVVYWDYDDLSMEIVSVGRLRKVLLSGVDIGLDQYRSYIVGPQMLDFSEKAIYRFGDLAVTRSNTYNRIYVFYNGRCLRINNYGDGTASIGNVYLDKPKIHWVNVKNIAICDETKLYIECGIIYLVDFEDRSVRISATKKGTLGVSSNWRVVGFIHEAPPCIGIEEYIRAIAMGEDFDFLYSYALDDKEFLQKNSTIDARNTASAFRDMWS